MLDPAGPRPSQTRPRRGARSLLLPVIAAGLILLPAMGWLAAGAGRLPFSIVHLELSPFFGGVDAVLRLLERAGALPAARLAVLWDFAFIPLYAAVGVGLVAALAPPGWRRRWAMAAIPAAALLDVTENLLLLHVLGERLGRPQAIPAVSAAWACAAATAKFLLLATALALPLPWARARDWKEAVTGWLGDLLRVLRPIWVLVCFVAGVAAALTAVAQSQDIIRRVAEEYAEGNTGPAVALTLAATFLAWCSWYWGRFLLTVQIGQEQPLSDERQRWFRDWIPRLLAPATFAGVALALWTGTFAGLDQAAAPAPDRWRAMLLWLGAAQLALGLLSYWLLAGRRRWGRLAHDRWGRAPAPGAGAASADGDRPGEEPWGAVLRRPRTWIAAGGSLAVAVTLVAGFTGWPVWMGARLSSAACLLLAGAAWIPLGSLAAAFGRWKRIHVLRWGVALALLFSLWNDNHRVPSRHAEAAGAAAGNATASASPPRPAIEARLTDWLHRIHQAHPGETRHRIYLVAAEGGGIRAAYWTAAALGRLERGSQGAFSERLFAISSVSGGSLGAAVFAAQLADGTPADAAATQVDGFLGADHLSPTLGRLLFPEVAQRFVFFPCFPDRAQALEQSWEDGWARTAGTGDPARFREPLPAALSPRAGAARVPVLLLNATRVESGTRVIVSTASTRSPFSDVFPDSTDAFELADPGLPLSTLVLLSARFPYVSPAARFDAGMVVDGGYFDGTGAATLLDVLTLLRRLGDPEPGHTLEPYVLLVTNGQSVDARPPVFAQLFAPAQALLQASSARSVNSIATVVAAVAAAGGVCKQLGVREGAVPLPLGWMLSSLARRRLAEEAGSVGWSAADGPQCGGLLGDPGMSGDLECSCAGLVTRPQGDVEPTSRTQ